MYHCIVHTQLVILALGLTCIVWLNEKSLLRKYVEAHKADVAKILWQRPGSLASHTTLWSIGWGQGWSLRWVPSDLKTPSDWSALYCLGWRTACHSQSRQLCTYFDKGTRTAVVWSNSMKWGERQLTTLSDSATKHHPRLTCNTLTFCKQSGGQCQFIWNYIMTHSTSSSDSNFGVHISRNPASLSDI